MLASNESLCLLIEILFTIDKIGLPKMVNVIDLKSDKTIASILDTKGVNGIAVANDINKAFISNGKDNSITVVNLKTFELLEKVKIAGVKPDAILYDQFFQKVFVYNAETNDATVIDAKTNKMVKTIPFGGKPEFSVTNTKKLIYVNTILWIQVLLTKGIV